MPYDLLAVGGTGQCVLLELLFRAERSTRTGILPRKVWILDRETDTWGSAITSQTKEIDQGSRPDGEFAIVKPAVPKNASTETMSMVLGGSFEPPPKKLPGLVARVLAEGLTPPEWTQAIEEGFFALPRLAAAWFGTVGLEIKAEFLTPAYLTVEIDGGPVPLFVVGSIAGGTGAGLLPSLLHSLRLSVPTLWRREVWFFPFLPYFNPRKGQRADERINLEQCRWNAAHAIQELEREQSLIHSRTVAAVPQEADRNNVPLTAISFIPPMVAPNELGDVSPPEPALVCGRKSFGGEIERGVDHLLAVDAYRANPQQHIPGAVDRRIHFGVMQFPGASAAGRIAGGDREYADFGRNGAVAEMTRTMHEELRAKRDRAQSLPGVIAAHGFGATLAGILHAQALSTGKGRTARRSDFWKTFDARTEERCAQLAELVEGIHPHTDVDVVLKAIDESWKDEARRARRLLALADSNDERAGAKLSDRLIDGLLGAKEGEASSLLLNAPHDTFAPPTGGLGPVTTTFAQAPVFGEFALPAEAANLLARRWRPADDPHAFHGSSWAKLMGHAHAYAAYVRDTAAGGGAPTVQTPLGVAWLLWKAAVAGLLTFEEWPISTSNPPERWQEAEEWDADFGGHLILLSFGGVAVGFSSADMGIVPAAQLSDKPLNARWNPNANAAAALVALQDAIQKIERVRLGKGQDSIAAVLHDFASFKARQPEIPWAKTLSFEALPGGQDPPGTVLRRSSIPSRRLWLRPALGQSPVEIQIPLLLDNLVELRKVAYGPTVRSITDDALLLMTDDTLHYREGSNTLSVLTLCPEEADQQRYVASVDHENLKRAAGALSTPSPETIANKQPLFALEWE